MRSQLRDHDDIVGRSVMAPPVEKILRSKEDTSVDKLFILPISSIHTGLHVIASLVNAKLLISIFSNRVSFRTVVQTFQHAPTHESNRRM